MAEQLPQVSKMMGELVAHQKCFESLDTTARQWVIMNPKEAIARFVRSVASTPRAKLPQELHLGVDYDVPVVELERACNFHERSVYVAFSHYGTGKHMRRFREFAFEDIIHTPEVLVYMAERKYRPASYLETLSFCRALPGEPTRDDLVALGSMAPSEQGTLVPVVSVFPERRWLSPRSCAPLFWSVYTSFLGVAL